MTAHSGILAWKIPWTEEPGEVQSMGSQTVTHDLSDFACTRMGMGRNGLSSRQAVYPQGRSARGQDDSAPVTGCVE